MKVEANLGFGRNFDFHIFLFTGKIVLVTLIVWASHGNLQVTEFLLQNGADVNVRNLHNGTALISASWNGHSKVVEILLNSGPEIDVENENGWTALDKAVMYRHFKIVEILLKHGAKIRQQTWELSCFQASRSDCVKIGDLLSTYQ